MLSRYHLNDLHFSCLRSSFRLDTSPKSPWKSKAKKVKTNNHFKPLLLLSLSHQIVPYPVVVILLVVVQPHLGQPDWVPPEHVDSRPPLVWRALAKDVANVGAGNNLEGAAAHPSLKKQEQTKFDDLRRGISEDFYRIDWDWKDFPNVSILSQFQTICFFHLFISKKGLKVEIWPVPPSIIWKCPRFSILWLFPSEPSLELKFKS